MTRLLLALALLHARAAIADVTVDVRPPAAPLYACQPLPVALHAVRPAGEGDGLSIAVSVPVPQPGQPALLLTRLDGAGGGVTCPPGGVAPPLTFVCDGRSASFSATVGGGAPPDLDVTATLHATAAGTHGLPLEIACAAGCARQPPTATLTVVDYPLTATVIASTTHARPGEQVTFTATVRNGGGLVVDGVVLEAPLPVGTELVAVTRDGQAVATAPSVMIGTLAPQTTTTIAVTLRAASLADGSQIDLATRLHGTPRGFACEASTSAGARVPVTTLRFEKSASVAHARRGDPVSYALHLEGPAVEPLPAGVYVSDDLPPEVSLVRLSGTLGGAPLGELTCPLAGVAVGPVTVACPGPAERGGNVKVTLAADAAGPLDLRLDTRVRDDAARSFTNLAQAVSTRKAMLLSAPVPVGLDGNGPFTLRAERALASRGDLVPLRAHLDTGLGLPGPAAVRLRLGRDLRLVGAARLLRDDGTLLDSPRPVERGELLDLPLPPLAANDHVTLELEARVGVLAGLGRRTVEAALLDGGRPLAGGRVTLEIVPEPEFDLCTLAGTVYRDDNGDGHRQAGEPGLGGVALVMEDGLTVVTDGEGRYHLAAVRPGQRLLKLVPSSLPAGARPTDDATRVLSLTAGVVAVVDFPVAVELAELPRPRPGAALGPGRLELGPAGLRYRVSGFAGPGGEAFLDGRAFPADASGWWSADLPIAPGTNRFLVAVARRLDAGGGGGAAGGEVLEIAERTVRRVEGAGGAGFVTPEGDETVAVLELPAQREGELFITGRASPRALLLRVGGREVRPGPGGRIEARVALPAAGSPDAGRLRVEIECDDGRRADFRRTLAPPGRVVLLAGIAEGRLRYVLGSGNQAEGSGLHAEGRVALYARGVIQGRWLLEGGLDLDSTAVSSWRDLFRGDPTRAFRALDPDRYYPVYGDASTAAERAPHRGPLYVKIAVDGSDLVVGNVQTGLTGVELGRYARTVTGVRLDVVRAGPARGAPPDTQVIVFGAWLPSGRAHDELRGTGGSLYFLSRRAVVEGSEQLRIEVRDALSDRPVENRALLRGVDYEIDPLAGRVALREPLSSVTQGPSLVRSGPLEGGRAFLVADYEYLVVGDSDDGAVGARVAQRLGPVRLGGTFASELRAGGNWWLAGGDARIDLGRFGAVVAEFARAGGAQAGFARSDDGGLTFDTAPAAGAAAPGGPGALAVPSRGNAWKVEADLHGFGLALRPYVRSIDRGFSDSAHVGGAAGRGLFQVGGEATADLLGARLRLHVDQRWLDGDDGVTSRLDAGGDVARRFGRFEVSLGARTLRQGGALEAHRTDVAARLGADLHPRLALYVLGQVSVERGGDAALTPLGRDASRGALGATVRLPADVTLDGEASYGAQGFGALLGLRRALGPDRTLYGTFSLSQDREATLSTALAVGGRQRLGPATLFAEDQFRDGRPGGVDPNAVADAARGRAHLGRAGVELPLSLSLDRRVAVGAAYEHGELSGSAFDAATLTRDAGSLSAAYSGGALSVQGKAELRRDARPGGEAPVQLLASGLLTLRATPELTLRAKGFYARTAATLGAALLSTTTEVNLGFAWRPSRVDGAALFGRYAFLADGGPPAQLRTPDSLGPTFTERAHVLSLGGEARLVWRLSLGGKLAAKRRDEDVAGAAPQWLLLWVTRLSLHVTREWDAVAEYRLLSSPGQQTAHGAALEVNRLLVGHLRLGAGWSFSAVTDDELQLGRGDAHGLFVRAQGYY